MRLIRPNIAALATRKDLSALVRELDLYRFQKIEGFWGRKSWKRVRQIIDALASLGRSAGSSLLAVVTSGDYWVKRKYAARALERIPGSADALAAIILSPFPIRATGVPDYLPRFTQAVIVRDIRTKLLAAWALKHNREPEAHYVLRMCLPRIEALVAVLAPLLRHPAGLAATARPEEKQLADGREAPEILEQLIEEGVELGAEFMLSRFTHPDIYLAPDDLFEMPDMGPDDGID